MNTWVLIAGIVVLAAQAAINKRGYMSQYTDLKNAIAQIRTDIGEAVTRITAKIEELGEPDPDLTEDLASLAAASAELDAIVADSSGGSGSGGTGGAGGGGSDVGTGDGTGTSTTGGGGSGTGMDPGTTDPADPTTTPGITPPDEQV